MTLQNIRIDTTTRSTVFNPLSASGQWLCSAFGRRTPGDFDAKYPTLVEATQDLTDLQSITLYSEYGDSMEWPHISSFVQVMSIQGVYVMINTYGMFDHKLCDKLKDQSVNVIFDIDGMHEQSGKVFLHSDWKIIKENILKLGSKARVKFYKFKHNAYQQNALQRFCDACRATLEVVEDPLFGRNIHSVIDENAKWLYDIHPVNSQENTLNKTMLGWNILKTKVRKGKGTSIEHRKNIPVPLHATQLTSDDFINITVKGHVIKGSSRAQIFSNALCEDWQIDMIDTKNKYNASVVNELSLFTKKDLDSINIYKNNILDITTKLLQ